MDGHCINNVIVSTNQQINSESMEENGSCNIGAGAFRNNCGLLQHLNFCRRRKTINNDKQTIATNYGNNNKTSNSNDSNGNNASDKMEKQKNFIRIWWQEVLLKRT